MKSFRLLLVAVFCSSVACAGPAPLVRPQDTGSSNDIGSSENRPAVGPIDPSPSHCLPPGVPLLSTLVRIGGVPAYGRAQRSDGQFEPIRLFRSYWARHTEDQDPILFINAANGYIATVDTEVLNPDAPYWYDTGMVNADGYYIVDGHPSCHWKRSGSRDDEQT